MTQHITEGLISGIGSHLRMIKAEQDLAPDVAIAHAEKVKVLAHELFCVLFAAQVTSGEVK